VLDGVWFRPYLLKPAAANTGANTDSTSTGNSLPPTAKVGVVGAVTTDANDWITLPALSDVPNGHEILILANAGGNFEMRTPTSSNEKINVSNTAGWVAQSLTKLGAVRTAVVPD
jgi:hypothetical protein